MDKSDQFHGLWGVILGGSSGFGLASAEKLASAGMNIAAVYREIASAERELKKRFEELEKQYSIQILASNTNALEKEGRESLAKELLKKAGPNSVKVLLHSIARGNLKPLAHDVNEQQLLTAEDIQYTSYAMSNSLLDWTRTLREAKLFNNDARIIGLTSEGAHRYWEGYAAVSIAKSSLESLANYMAVEFSPYGIKTNLIQAGITETASLKRIPGNDKLLEMGAMRNPMGRITQPQDVANVVYLLCTDEAAWINGALIHADGGEHCR